MTCEHTAIVGDEKGHRCNQCGQRMREVVSPCSHCNGLGRINDHTCWSCEGSGEEVDFEPEVEDTETDEAL